MNEDDSGTELDSQGEEEEEVAATENKDEEEKKDDWVEWSVEEILCNFYS